MSTYCDILVQSQDSGGSACHAAIASAVNQAAPLAQAGVRRAPARDPVLLLEDVAAARAFSLKGTGSIRIVKTSLAYPASLPTTTR